MLTNRKGKPLRRVTITVDADDFVAFDRLARNQDASASWLIRRSMREFLHRNLRLPSTSKRQARGKSGKN